MKTRPDTVPSLLGALCLLACISSIADSPRLFRDFVFGMPKSELLELPDIYDCSADLGAEGWLCLPEGGDTFANTGVEVAFSLIDDALFSVTLATGFSQQKYVDFFAALSSRHELVAIGGAQGVLDLLVEARNAGGDRAAYRKSIVDFENHALQDGTINYTFVAKSWLQSDSAAGARTAVGLLAKMAADDRLVELSATNGEGEFAGDAFLTVRFTLPKMLETVIASKAQQDDDF